MHRIVHFDLKGAPPKLHYFEQVLRSIKYWGATGVLLEWEDTFPYTSNLAHLGSVCNNGGDGLYTLGEVQQILHLCKELGLEVIQLVQTIGHLEFVLKHQRHAHLREVSRTPAVLCPLKWDSKQLVREIIVQVLAVQPDAKYFHIGADEVWHIGVCPDCVKRVTCPKDNWCIYLEYIRDLVIFIKELRPNLTVLMWDDMLRSMSPSVLQEYKLSDLVQPVVWNYEVKETFLFPEPMWDMYKVFFPTVWAGSAFKGANGSSQMVSPVRRYVSNHEAWLSEMGKLSHCIKFAGVILTGWSRYDHFATLCELLPSSLNSLYNCLKCLIGPVTYEDLYKDDLLPEAEWPGVGLAKGVRMLAAILDGDYRILKSDLLAVDVRTVESCALEQLSALFGPRCVAEWARVRVAPLAADLARVLDDAERARV